MNLRGRRLYYTSPHLLLLPIVQFRTWNGSYNSTWNRRQSCRTIPWYHHSVGHFGPLASDRRTGGDTIIKTTCTDAQHLHLALRGAMATVHKCAKNVCLEKLSVIWPACYDARKLIANCPRVVVECTTMNDQYTTCCCFLLKNRDFPTLLLLLTNLYTNKLVCTPAREITGLDGRRIGG